MRWLKREIGKLGIAVAGLLLLLVLMVWVPVSAAGTYEGASGLATPITETVQATPTEDATVTALNKEKLTQEVAQQQHTWENWLWSNAATVSSALVIVLGGLFGLWRWLADQRSEREKRVEERLRARFEALSSIVTGLGDEKEGARLGAAILLRTFLSQEGSEQFSTQVFDLAVANLRLPGTSGLSEDSNAPLLLTTFRQALISVFAETVPRARDEWRKERKEELFDPRFLNATHIYLDNSLLQKADLKQVWLGWASLRRASLVQANLGGTWLWHADLREADLSGADLRRADLGSTKIGQARLNAANLRGATLWGADLRGADLRRADLRGATSEEAPFLLAVARRDRRDTEATTLLLADLRGADLREAKLHGAMLSLADLRGADLREADLSEADLCGADLRGARLDKAQLCKVKLGRVLLSGPHFIQDKLTMNEVREIKLTEETELTKVKIRGVDLLGEVDRRTLPWDELRRWVHYIRVDDPRADLSGAQLLLPELSDTNLEGTDLRGVKGLTKKQLEDCRARGAIIDKAPATSSSQSPVAPPSPSQSNDLQAPSAPPAQVNTPPPETDRSSATSSKPDLEP